jgi:3',5'-cyclic AMP phosphodiesterase CpdA
VRTLVHLSDLHFGRTDEAVVGPLIAAVHQLRPDLVAVSGDLTQRARSAQFREARAFLDALPQPQIVVPGNHDVPLHNVYSRFADPLGKYRRYITADLEPFYTDEEIAVVGLNTARALTIKGGRISSEQVRRARERLCGLSASGQEPVKFVVTHHPFDVPAGGSDRDVVGRARRAMAALADCGADILLAGHLHVSNTAHSAVRYPDAGHNALLIQAGTAVSSRGRGEANSFNMITVNRELVTVERREWSPERGAFCAASAESFCRESGGWRPATA